MSKSSLSSLTEESHDDDIVFRTKRNKGHPKIGDIDSVKIGNTNYKISSTIHPDKRFDAEKRLLGRNNLEYKEIDISTDPNLMDEMIKKAGGKKTIPQIFFEDHHVGGYQELRELEKTGNLLKSLE